MNCEIIEEIESLTYIYPNELSIINENEIEITIPNDDPEISEISFLFTVNVKFNDKYPNEPPELQLTNACKDSLNNEEESGLSEDELRELNVFIGNNINEFIGLPMVYSIVSSLKEHAEIIIKNRKIINNLPEESTEISNEMENIVLGSTDKEIFQEWKKSFIQEAYAAEKTGKLSLAFEAVLAVERMNEVKQKMTGRQLFESMNTGDYDSDME